MTNRLFAYGIALAIFLVDQISKWWVNGPLALQLEGQQIDLLPIFDLTRVHNYGISLGLAQAQNDTHRWILVAVDGITLSGVVVATMIRSTSSAGRPAGSSAWRAAATPRSLALTVASAKRRARMPVRSSIHSSEEALL